MLMSFCLLWEGLILLLAGFPLPGQPIFLYVIGCLWSATVVTMFFFRQKPQLTIGLGCLLFAVNGYHMWSISAEEKALDWFLYQHSLEIGFIVASCIAWYLLRKQSSFRDS